MKRWERWWCRLHSGLKKNTRRVNRIYTKKKTRRKLTRQVARIFAFLLGWEGAYHGWTLKICTNILAAARWSPWSRIWYFFFTNTRVHRRGAEVGKLLENSNKLHVCESEIFSSVYFSCARRFMFVVHIYIFTVMQRRETILTNFEEATPRERVREGEEKLLIFPQK